MGSTPYQADQLHFILFPFMAQGHMIPMVDIAKLLARRSGALTTIFTTPHNAARFEAVFSRATQSGLRIRVVLLNFPCEEAGLPHGCENCDLIPSSSYFPNFITAVFMLQKPVEDMVKELTPPPNCLISDMCLPWTIDVARMLAIPRIAFHGLSCFCLLCIHSIRTSNILYKIDSESDCFALPDLPDRVEVTKPQLPTTLVSTSSDFNQKRVVADLESYGVIVNTFQELEPEYAKEYKSARNGKVWCVGPVSLGANKEQLDKAQRGNKSSMDENQCLKWLDSKDPGSVVYACLGSLGNLRDSHLKELGLGLEASNRPFIWVIRGGNNNVLEELNKWIEEDGFEERIKCRGILIRGWAPQILILSNPAIGGFLTHCGWNSTLEGISAGIAMVTWPLFADQFLNEKLVTQILKIGVRIGVEVPTPLLEEDTIGVLVKKEDVKRAIDELMDEDGQESQERRERARELGLMANKAVEEGGSSDLNLLSFIKEILLLAIDKFNNERQKTDLLI